MKMLRYFLTLVSMILVTALIIPPVASAVELPIDAQSKTEQVILQITDEAILSAEVPADKVQEYKENLKDENFREHEVNKITQSINNKIQTNSADGSRVFLFRKREVLAMVDSMDKSRDWMKYVDSNLTGALLNAAISIISKSNIVGAIANVLYVAAQNLLDRQEAWWRESAIMILKRQITGVRIRMVPNNGGYPVMYRYIERY